MTISLITKGYICPTVVTTNYSIFLEAELSNCELPCSDCSQPSIKRENSAILDFIITSDGIRLTQATLDAADNVIFAVKDDPQDSNAEALILKSITTGGLVTLPDGDDESPNVQVTLTSADTNLADGSYPTGLQVDFGTDDCKEASLILSGQCFESITIEQDIIRC